MIPTVETIVTLLLGGGGTAVVTSVLQWRKDTAAARNGDRAVDVQIEEHQNKLTFDLLSAARVEIAAAREEASGLRPLVARLAHFEEALDHIHALLHAEMHDEKIAAEKRARAFLNRMRRLADARGTIINEIQRQESAQSLIDKDIGA